LLVPVAQASRRLSPVLAETIYGFLEGLELRFMPVLVKLEEPICHPCPGISQPTGVARNEASVW